MEQLNGVQYYQARRGNVLKILEERGPLTLNQIKEEYRKRFHKAMPFDDGDDKSIHSWLAQIETVGVDLKKANPVYYTKKSVYMHKRRTSSPIGGDPRLGIKRSRSAPENEENTFGKSSTSNENSGRPRQARAVRFMNQPYLNNGKSRSKSEHRPALIGAPNIYGCYLFSDDFFMALATNKLNYRAGKNSGILQSGFCVSGLTIRGAIRKLEEIEDNHFKTMILYIGSIDIALEKESIEMMQAFIELMAKFAKKNIRPILCTLAPMPNQIHGNRIQTLQAFNEFIRSNKFSLPVIDIHFGFMKNKSSEIYEESYFSRSAHKVSGCRKDLVLWSREGTDRVFEMLNKNIGNALVCKTEEIFSHI